MSNKTTTAAAATATLRTIADLAEVDLCGAELALARFGFRMGCEDRMAADDRLVVPTVEGLCEVIADLMMNVSLWEMGAASCLFTDAACTDELGLS